MIKTLIDQIQKSEQEAERILRKARREVDELNSTADTKIAKEKQAILEAAKVLSHDLVAEAAANAQNDIDALKPPSQPHDIEQRVANAAAYLYGLVQKRYES